MAPMTGVRMSPTSELTMAPKAAPMITPIARSTALPRNANFLNSSSMRCSHAAPAGSSVDAAARRVGRVFAAHDLLDGKCQSARGRLVGQAGVDHCLAPGGTRFLPPRDPSQP